MAKKKKSPKRPQTEAEMIEQALKLDDTPPKEEKPIRFQPSGQRQLPLGRQGSGENEDPFNQLYDQYGLVLPDYDPQDMWDTVKKSDLLTLAHRIYTDNIARQWDYETAREYVDPEQEDVKQEKIKLRDFFGQVNPEESWSSLMKQVIPDLFFNIGGFIEVIREPKKDEPDQLYYIPCTHMRVTPLDQEPTLVYTQMRRNGKLEQRAVFKRFRRFARVYDSGMIQWFKQYGDPRVVDRTSGEYVRDSQGNYVREPSQYFNKATEIWWLRDSVAGDTYGTPIWISAMNDVLGRYEAQWVNHDTLESGGFPPWLLMVFGKLSKGTREYLKAWIEHLRDPSSYNEPGILEIEASKMSLNQAGGGKSSAQFVPMRDMRAEDGMFHKYQADTFKTTMLLHRFYSLVLGGAEWKKHEEQEVYKPMREWLDNKVTVDIIQNGFGIYNWKMRTRSASIADMEMYYKAVGMAGRTGGPTLAELRKMQNEVFGQNFPELEGSPFYTKLSAAEAIGLVRQGSVTYDPKTWEPTPIDPRGQQPGLPAGTAQKMDDESVNDRLTKLGITADVINLATALRNVSEDIDEDWEPPDIDDGDFVQ